MKSFKEATLLENYHRLTETKPDVPFSTGDMLLTISVNDVITMLESNAEPPYTKAQIFSAYSTILKDASVDAKHILDVNTAKILKYLNN